MCVYEDLESLYQHLEDHAENYKYPHQIGNLFQKLRDQAGRKADVGTEQRAQWEIDAFHVGLNSGGADAFFTQTDTKGELVRWPDIAKFSEEIYTYLNSRATETANAILKARYAHILWCSPRKHQRYARMAIEAYLNLVQLYEAKDLEDPKAHFGLAVLDSVENAHAISCQVRWGMQDVGAEIRRLVLDFNRASSSAFAVRVNLIRLMLGRPKKFSKDDLDGLAEICWRTSCDLVTSGNFHGAVKMLELGQRIDVKTGRCTHSWSRQRAKFYEQLMSQRKAGDLAAPEFCRLAIESYRQARDDSAVTRLEKEYQRLKEAMKFEGFGGEVDVSDIVRRSAETADRLAERPPQDTIRWLMGSQSLLPNYKDLEEGAEAAMGKYIFLQVMPVTVLDDTGHAAQHFVEPDERKYHAMLKDYQVYIEAVTCLYLRQVLVRVIGSGKLDVTSLVEFLRKHSWIGRDLRVGLPDNRVAVYNWLGLLAPALQEYFRQIASWMASRQCQSNFVLIVDSLVLKIEGLLRDMCRFSGGSTSYSTPDKKGRTVERQKDVHMLLYDPQLIELIGLDDLLFLRFLLVEKAGYNLRHKVAHALMLRGQYVFDYANLLILALLRLAGYDLCEQQKDGRGADSG